MANNAAGNLYFVDTANLSIDIKNIRIISIIIHCTHSSSAASIELGDNNSGRSYPTLFKIEVPAANDYAHLDFTRSPLVFPNGIRIKTISNAEMTIILDKNTSS